MRHFGLSQVIYPTLARQVAVRSGVCMTSTLLHGYYPARLGKLYAYCGNQMTHAIQQTTAKHYV